MKSKFNLILTLFVVFFVQAFHAQDRKVTGVVTDSKGVTLPFVNVNLKGTKVSTQTDIDGKYVINAAANQTLVFSFVGFDNQELLASSQKINVKMKDKSNVLEDVVVTAFNIKRNPKKMSVGVSKVKVSDLTENSEPDLLRSLSGKVAGVNVNSSTGVAGAANKITIRGINTISGNSQPLFVVDGVIFSNQSTESSSLVTGGASYESGISSLDPNNIASMTVLKSSAASALYGSRGANGVIVITTKTGSANNKSAQKMTVSFGTGTFFENIANLPEYQNTYGAGSQFGYTNANGSWGPRFGSIADANNGLTPNPDGASLPGLIPQWPSFKAAFPGLLPDFIPYVAKPNNVKDLFRTGIVLDNTVGINYVGKEGSFNATISDMNQDGYIPFNTYNRTSIAIGGNFKLTEKLTAGGNMSFSDTKQVGGFSGENQFATASSSFARTLFLARNWDLNLPFTNPSTGASVTPNGTQFDHPLWSLENDQSKTGTNRTIAGLNLSYEINKNLNLGYRIGYNNYILERDDVRSPGSKAAILGSINRDFAKNESIESTLLLNLDYKLTESIGLKSILGQNILQTKTYRNRILGEEFKLPKINTFENLKTLTPTTDQGDQKRNVGHFVDVTLDYKEYFFLNATGRNDISSTLNKNKNSYFYPSVSASFIISDAFKIKNSVLSFAKIRASYARTANDVDAEATLNPLSFDNNFGTSPTITQPQTVANPFLSPELTFEKEFGVDLELFKSRIIVDFSIYDKTSEDLHVYRSVPGSTGGFQYFDNAASMQNKGVELGLTLVPLKSKDFKWTLFTNYSQNKNEVLSLAPGLERLSLRPNTISYAIPGQPFGVFYGDKFARDVNGNYLINPTGGGIIAAAESGIIGDPNAKFKMSFINTLAYKGFSLKTQFDWKQGGDVFSTTIQSLLGRGVTKDTEDREHTNIIPGFYGNPDGTPILDGSGNQIPNITQISTNDLYFSPNSGAGGNTFAINSVDEASIYDGTIYRLREASLTYDLPSKFLDKTPFGKISFSIMGNNLWYFAPNVPKYTNFDTDATSFGSSNIQGVEVSAAPTSKRYGFKLNLTF